MFIGKQDAQRRRGVGRGVAWTVVGSIHMDVLLIAGSCDIANRVDSVRGGWRSIQGVITSKSACNNRWQGTYCVSITPKAIDWKEAALSPFVLLYFRSIA